MFPYKQSKMLPNARKRLKAEKICNPFTCKHIDVHKQYHTVKWTAYGKQLCYTESILNPIAQQFSL